MKYKVNGSYELNIGCDAALCPFMTLEYKILQRLGSGPVPLSALGDIGDDGLDRMLNIMAARRQICVRDRQVSLFWHRHMISRMGGAVHGGGVAFA